MRIRAILAAAAAPAALAAVLLGTAGQASAAVQPSAPSAYFWQPNGHALTGPQQMPGGSVSLAGGYLAKVTADEHNASILGKTITITGTLTGGPFADQPNGGDPVPPAAPDPTAQVYFEGGGAGTNANSPDGYQGQQWWSHAQVQHLNSTGAISITLPVNPADWSDWNGQYGDANPDLFNAAASHVRDLGLSFGGGWFSENGVTGQGTLTNVSITVSS